ncbi:hypothetical protein A7M65_19520 [Acinetobacter baumannii]|nr:hypothetical protein A7M65_19520 [Acinetobacter baumannii]
MSYFQHKNKPREHFPTRITDEAGASQSGGRRSFQEGRNAQLAACWDYNHVLGLPAVLLLKMTQSE